MTRRQLIAALGASALAPLARPQAAAEKNGGLKAGVTRGARATPTVCVYSKNLAKIPYATLGLIAQQMGYDGVDLTVMQGGHVDPHIVNVDLVRAIESVRGASLDVPMISTEITAINDPTAYPILAISGRTDVNLYRTGFWPWGTPVNTARRLAQVRADLSGLIALGKQAGMVAMVPNRADSVGASLFDIQVMIGDTDPARIGYEFDPSQTPDWEPALSLALPRLKAVVVQDFKWDQKEMKFCPLGEGVVEWPKFFKALAVARFTGPLSIRYEYKAEDEVAAMTKDLEFVRKQIQQAYVS